MSYSVRPYGLHPARLLCPWDSLGKDTGVGWHDLFQGIFQTQVRFPALALPLLPSAKSFRGHNYTQNKTTCAPYLETMLTVCQRIFGESNIIWDSIHAKRLICLHNGLFTKIKYYSHYFPAYSLMFH